MSNKASSLALIKSESKGNNVTFTPAVVAPGCDLCDEPIAARVNVETEEETFQPMDLCARHLDHLRQYLGAERYAAALESDESKIA